MSSIRTVSSSGGFESSESATSDRQDSASAPPGVPDEGGQHSGEDDKSTPSLNEEWPKLDLEIDENLQIYWEENKRRLFTDKARAEAWAKMDSAVKDYTDDLVERWNKEIDSLLTYAGLFSAILTAFNVESYQLLYQTAPDSQAVLATLQQISTQMRSYSLTPPFLNSTVADAPPTQLSGTSPVETWKVWLNALWFSSLICSLSAASIGIMVKQWLSEHASGLYGNYRQTGRLRQYRLDGLRRWHVAEIVAIIPVLLLAALFLFFAGLLVLLSQLNTTVTVIAAIFIGALVTFTVLTTVLPAWHTDCSYVSPQSLATYYAKQYADALFTPLLTHVHVQQRLLGRLLSPILPAAGATSRPRWRLRLWELRELGMPWRCSRLNGALFYLAPLIPRIWKALRCPFQWIEKAITFIGAQTKLLGMSLRNVHIPQYRRVELNCVEESRNELDVSTLAMALPIGGGQSLLDSATACFSNLVPQQVLDYCQKVEADHKFAAGDKNVKTSVDGWFASLPPDMCSDILVALACAPSETGSALDKSWEGHLNYIVQALSVSSSPPIHDVARSSVIFDNLAGIIVAHIQPCLVDPLQVPISLHLLQSNAGAYCLVTIVTAMSDLWTRARTQLERSGTTFDEVTYRRVATALDAMLSYTSFRNEISVHAKLVLRLCTTRLLIDICTGHDSLASSGTPEAGRNSDGNRTSDSDAIMKVVRDVRAYALEALPLLLKRVLKEARHAPSYAHSFVSYCILHGVELAGLISPELLDVLSLYVETYEPEPGNHRQTIWEGNKAQISTLQEAYKQSMGQPPVTGLDAAGAAATDSTPGDVDGARAPGPQAAANHKDKAAQT